MQYQQFPRSRGITKELQDVVKAFAKVEDKISSAANSLTSNEVLSFLCPHLMSIGYKVETGKSVEKKIDVPVLFGRDNHIDKSFFADALSADGRIVIEVEAGQAIENHRFLKDIFEASMMFDVEYLVLAVRNKYRSHLDFDRVYQFLETMYISNRIILPLKGIMLIGY